MKAGSTAEPKQKHLQSLETSWIGKLALNEDRTTEPPALLATDRSAVLPRSSSIQRRRRSEAVAKGDYFQETRRPLISLAFVLPLVILYEWGSIFAQPGASKSGVDRWVQQGLDSLGMGHVVILPIITVAALLIWHHRKLDSWSLRPSVLLGMLCESAGLGLLLFLAGNAVYQIIVLDVDAVASTTSTATLGSQGWSTTLAYIGSGVYEEFLFRLLLLNSLIVLGQKFLPSRSAQWMGIVVTSLLFAALHYNVFNPAAADFELGGFLFRFFASTIFCLLFLFRGFGITVGTHATFDVLTQI